MFSRRKTSPVFVEAERDVELELAVERANSDPCDKSLQLAAFDSYITSGSRACSEHDLDLALIYFDSAYRVLRGISSSHGDDFDLYRRTLLVLKYQREVYYAQFRMRDFLGSLKASLNICDQFIQHWPDEISWKIYFASLEFKVLQVALTLGEPQMAIAASARGLAIMETLASKYPSNPQYAVAVGNFRKYSQLFHVPLWIHRTLSIWSRLVISLLSATRISMRKEYSQFGDPRLP